MFGRQPNDPTDLGIWPDDEGAYVLWIDVRELADENARLREALKDAEHLCRWLLQSDIEPADRERVTRENGINFAAALQGQSVRQEVRG
jgi:hypothetical protein